MPHPFTPSAQQQTFFDWVAHKTGCATLIAVAGAGKSTSIIEALIYIPENKSVGIVVFSADMAPELKAKVAALGEREGRAFRGVRVSTFHALGMGAIRKRLGTVPVTVDPGKIRRLMKARCTEADVEMYGDFVFKLVGLAKGEGIGVLVPDTADAYRNLIAHHDLYLDSEDASEDRAIDLARKLLALSCEVAKTGDIDFNDQLYLPLLWRLKLWQNDWLFIDEAQDTNPVRRAIAKLALRPGGRLVAVGDPKQAIFGFTGASHDSLDLIEREFNCKRLYLTVSYRCAQAVVRKAQRVVDYIQAAPGAPEGLDDARTLAEALKVLGPRDAILCRQVAPLITLAYTLLAAGRPCKVLGREIGDGLVNLIQRQKARGIDRLLEKLEAFSQREIANFMAKGQEQKAEGVVDRLESIKVVIGQLAETERTIPALIAKITTLFADKADCLILSSIHKSKGKEYDVVAILRPELSPSKYARQEHQYQEELNLMYVRDTRAKRHIMELTTDTMEKLKVAA